jgi:hypothetical protein
MFELNLIKDKAKARQRRRVIFLSIVCILFLAGLLSIFVGSLFWRETIQLKTLNNNIADAENLNNTMKADLDVREPAARTRRNALISAWEEDMRVLKDRPYFTPVLEDVTKYHPRTAEFWYNLITISASTGGSGPRGTAKEESVSAEALLDSRALEANGYIEIEASDILTESELKQMSSQMRNLTNLVGEPNYNLDVNQEIIPGGDTEANRYVPFTMRAAQTTFRSGAVGE